MLKAISDKVRALHNDEQGADMVEYILIVAAIALPVLGIVIWFWKDFAKWANELWMRGKGQTGQNPSELEVE